MSLTLTPFAMCCFVVFLSFAYVNYICLCVTTRFAYTKVPFLKHRSRIQFHSIAYVNYICICATVRFASTKLPCIFDQQSNEKPMFFKTFAHSHTVYGFCGFCFLCIFIHLDVRITYVNAQPRVSPTRNYHF